MQCLIIKSKRVANVTRYLLEGRSNMNEYKYLYYYRFSALMRISKKEFINPQTGQVVQIKQPCNYRVDIYSEHAKFYVATFTMETIQRIIFQFVKKYGIETADMFRIIKKYSKPNEYRLYSLEDIDIIKDIWKVVQDGNI